MIEKSKDFVDNEQHLEEESEIHGQQSNESFDEDSDDGSEPVTESLLSGSEGVQTNSASEEMVSFFYIHIAAGMA